MPTTTSRCKKKSRCEETGSVGRSQKETGREREKETGSVEQKKREREKETGCVEQENKNKKGARAKTKRGQIVSGNPSFRSYVAGMGAEAAAASKTTSVEDRNKADCLFKIGQRVSGLWPALDEEDGGGWYNGVVISLDYCHRTVHIKYDDGDSDDAVHWYNACIMEDEDE